MHTTSWPALFSIHAEQIQHHAKVSLGVKNHITLAKKSNQASHEVQLFYAKCCLEKKFWTQFLHYNGVVLNQYRNEILDVITCMTKALAKMGF